MKEGNSLISNDKLAAIAIALYKYAESLSYDESMMLTINSVTKMYSPWNSKFYGLRQLPNKKN